MEAEKAKGQLRMEDGETKEGEVEAGETREVTVEDGEMMTGVRDGETGAEGGNVVQKGAADGQGVEPFAGVGEVEGRVVGAEAVIAMARRGRRCLSGNVNTRLGRQSANRGCRNKLMNFRVPTTCTVYRQCLLPCAQDAALHTVSSYKRPWICRNVKTPQVSPWV